VDEVEQQAPVLPVEVLDAETALLFGQHNFIPSNQTASTRTRVFPGPEKGATPLINTF
jgi:hypothetical protein